MCPLLFPTKYKSSSPFIPILWPWPRHSTPPPPPPPPPPPLPPIPMASITTAAAAAAASSFLHRRRRLAAAASPPRGTAAATLRHHHIQHHQRVVGCRAAEVSGAEPSAAAASGDGNWVPVVPLAALPRGERRVIVQDGEEILLLWYKEQVYAVENRSPAEGAYTEGLLNAKLTQDGCIVCPTTDSTFDLRTGEIKEWYPKNPVLRALTPALRKLFVYPVKIDGENIYISISGAVTSGGSAEIIFSGKAQPGFTASDVNIEEVRMVIDEDVGGFGFTNKNELINGKAAIIGFLLLIDFELLTGKGLLKGTGLLDFIYAISRAFSS
uniref:Rieske domain-containing protein n=1 Tax=Oryza meridionalis TaxID=40149 RepID=A0A0E0F441_9ORYZ